jgi:hypothetical protein
MPQQIIPFWRSASSHIHKLTGAQIEDLFVVKGLCARS